MGPRFKVPSERLEKIGIEPTTPGLQGESLYHFTSEAATQMQDKVVPLYTYEPRREKPNVLVSDLVRHKSGCTATEVG